ncbi:MAG TPA: hypothetical protein VG106_01235, partial [Vicinamibacterales bacterium]|nr:hypothetical protein [Vicinamibacterales bacterium]
QQINSGARANVKWEDTWRLAKPRQDVHLVAIAEGPGVAAPYWPTARPYQPTSIEFTPYVLAVSGAVFVDADGSGRFESAHEYARREISAADGDVRSLATKLGAYDGAVAVQAASLLRGQSGEDFEARIRSMLQIAPAHVARGLSTYLDAWKAVVPGSKPQQLRASPAAGTR